MGWIAPVAGSIAGGLLSNKGAKQAASTAAQGQMDLSNQMFDKATAYQQQQQNALRSAITGMAPMVGSFYNAAGAMHPPFMAPSAGATSFHGGAIPQPPGAASNKFAGQPGGGGTLTTGMGGGARSQPPTSGPYPNPSPPPVAGGAPLPGPTDQGGGWGPPQLPLRPFPGANQGVHPIMSPRMTL